MCQCQSSAACLSNKCAQYNPDGCARQGVHFASWRSEFRIDGDEMPSEEALVRNTAEIAVFARVALNAGLVPVIEADVLPDGVHSHEVHYDASSLVLRRIIYQLGVHKIPLSAIVFRIQMVQAGKDAPGVERGEDADTPRLTLELLRDCVPSSVPGVYFKSGAFDEEKATAHLDVIGRQADIAKGASGRHTAPWTLSFGFGRDLQMSAMAVWLQSERNATKAGIIAGDVCRVNADAMLGEYGGEHPAAAMQY
jgi:fructose-bisphosphate aldolase class I